MYRRFVVVSWPKNYHAAKSFRNPATVTWKSFFFLPFSTWTSCSSSIFCIHLPVLLKAKTKTPSFWLQTRSEGETRLINLQDSEAIFPSSLHKFSIFAPQQGFSVRSSPEKSDQVNGVSNYSLMMFAFLDCFLSSGGELQPKDAFVNRKLTRPDESSTFSLLWDLKHC